MSTNDTSKNQYNLYSQEELTNMEPDNQNNQPEGPVTCLGLEFPNEEARREYFREELRKQLPELRKIEGFPIGTDDDIINLSDPPYYTACPNPWLNDFIAEWEKEKTQLEAEGKRKADFEVKEPYASDVSEGKNNPIYNAHSYHTKVPHPAIMRYILHYTQPGDIVYDGFAGTGMTGVAAQMCEKPDAQLKEKIEKEVKELGQKKIEWGKRHAILGDLSPVASFIAYNYNTPINTKQFEIEAKKVLAEVEKECSWMYETHHTNGSKCKINYVIWSDVFICSNCGREIVFYDAAVDKENAKVLDVFLCPHCRASQTKKTASKAVVTVFDKALNKTIQQTKSVPVIIQYSDSKGNQFEKKPDNLDFALLERINNLDIPYWFPTELMCEGHEAHRNDKYGLTNVHHFYTKRALYAFACMRSKFNQKQLWLLTSILEGGSKLNRERPFGLPSKLAGTLYVGSTIREIDVVSFAKRKLKRYIAACFDKDPNATNLSINSATQISAASNTIDYIFTDPPFGANLMYSELNYLQESWLKIKTNNKEEAVENDAQQKSLIDYGLIMQRCFNEYYRILKPGKWMTVEFSNTSASVWNSIQNALIQSGFVVVNVAALDKQQGSFKAVTTTTAVKQDLVITCYKPSDELSSQFEQQMDRKDVVWDFIQEHMEHLAIHIEKESKTTTVIERSPKILYDRLISYYVQHGMPVPMDALEFQQGLRERFVERDGMFFTATQAAEYEEKRKNTEGFAPMGIIVSDEANGIEWLRNQLREAPKTYAEIMPEWMQAINGVRKGDILPELRTILEENFIKMEDGKWRLPNVQDDVDKNLLRTKALLREFNLYKEQAMKPKAKLKEVRVEALRAGFKQCYMDKDFETIVLVGDKIPQNLRDEDEVLLQFYDIALNKL